MLFSNNLTVRVKYLVLSQLYHMFIIVQLQQIRW